MEQEYLFKKNILKICVVALLVWGDVLGVRGHNSVTVDTLANGIYRLSIGVPDKFTPYDFCPKEPKYDALDELAAGELPFMLEDIDMRVTGRGSRVCIPLQDGEQLYGFGLQIGSFQQRGLKKKPIVNDHPLNTLGYTHAPQPFYVSSKGYGILVNTLRYTTFYCGTHTEKHVQKESFSPTGDVKTSTEELYANKKSGSYVYVDIPNCDGVEVFIFKASDLKGAVQKYNLFSGGGCLPPMWGLGFKYRTKTDFTQEGVMRVQAYFRDKKIPCDVIGLEPGWHTAAYSCSYVWNKERYLDHHSMLKVLNENHYKVNLWEHAYVHPTSPLWKPLKDYSGDFLVWGGLVPDFALPETRTRFSDYHKQLMREGISGFKLDECDNSDISVGNATWGFPEMSTFPSGMDGEQVHQAFGMLYLRTLNEMYANENIRTFQDYRSSGLFASSIPASLYSDIYGYKDYIEMVCNSAFGGLLWSPEVRQSGSKAEFFRRLQVVLLSAHAVVDSWFLQNPPWLQYDKDKNNAGVFLTDSLEMENITRKQVNQRMRLLPYLYNAFAHYCMEGIPPFRPLLMDFSEDVKVQNITNQYMMGDNLMVTPLLDDTGKRTVYFPKGTWYNFNTNERYEGGGEHEVTIAMDEMPLFVKGGTILPLAKPLQYVADNSVFDIVCHVYGDASETAFTLFEDDGVSYDFERKNSYNWLFLEVKNGKGKCKRKGAYKGKRYNVSEWVFVK
ncbi:TIM-barrel domain-containing protein [Bacteroides sp. GD17]|jgi:alpha-D-xyloside xylohydrolase|uniref:glycoside hydrolase family 31 protein n=1 Tax=Bacteroides sp. GD17 TaxID=3139826 RepID=UPI00313C3091